MSQTQTFAVDMGWRLLLKDLGMDVDELLRRAELPGDLFLRENYRLAPDAYFRLLSCFEAMSGDPSIGLKVGSMVSVEHFNPPIFAAFCSPNMNTAAERLSQFKKLLGPIDLVVERTNESTSISYELLPPAKEPPLVSVAIELVFLVRLIRLATREEIHPVAVTSRYDFPCADEYEAFFGIPMGKGDRDCVVFAAEDAALPFLTANEKMWEFFVPELRSRLSSLQHEATTTERVKGVLLELLPSGQASVGQVAKRLHMSTRTLQRRLKQEQTSFQQLLNGCREQLARHYLRNSSMSGAEISFLLGFDEPNSFFRAFHAWTGQTPERVRASYQHA